MFALVFLHFFLWSTLAVSFASSSASVRSLFGRRGATSKKNEGGKSDQDIDDVFENRDASEKQVDQVEFKETYESPVKSPDKNKSVSAFLKSGRLLCVHSLRLALNLNFKGGHGSF